jgi:uncharacterized membrane protein
MARRKKIKRPEGLTDAAPGRARGRAACRAALALLYLVAGFFHLATPHPFLRITPHWVPLPETIIALTGVAEVLGAAALAQPISLPLRRMAGVALAIYALCVWPANINHVMIDMARTDHGWGLAYHVPRILAQPVLIWLALWAGEVVEWPFQAAPISPRRPRRK